MSKTDGDKAVEARRKAYEEWMEDEGNAFIGTLGEKHRRLAEHVLWNAFKAGEKHGRAKLDDILSKGPQSSHRDTERVEALERLLCAGGSLTYFREGMRCEFTPGLLGQGTLRPFLDDLLEAILSHGRGEA
jgi:hypothetical protein